MKRIYMVVALLGAMFSTTYAQTIDLEAVIGKPVAGQSMGPGQQYDTADVIAGMYYTGPDAILTGDIGWFMTSFSRPATDSTTYISGVLWNADITVADSGFIFVFPNANEIGIGHTAPYTVASDSIRGLYDWNQWNLNDSIVLIRPPYTNGTSYGFFFRALFIGDEEANSLATDPTPDNNRAVQRIVWGTGTGLNEMFPDKEVKSIVAYPNPAVAQINFDFNFDKASHAQVFVRDITGKVVKAKNFGRTQAGVQKFTLDISGLSNGMYTLEFDTDLQTATTKFNVSK